MVVDLVETRNGSGRSASTLLRHRFEEVSGSRVSCDSTEDDATQQRGTSESVRSVNSTDCRSTRCEVSICRGENKVAVERKRENIPTSPEAKSPLIGCPDLLTTSAFVFPSRPPIVSSNRNESVLAMFEQKKQSRTNSEEQES